MTATIDLDVIIGTCKHEGCEKGITRRENGLNGGLCDDHAGLYCPICDESIAGKPGDLCEYCNEN